MRIISGQYKGWFQHQIRHQTLNWKIFKNQSSAAHWSQTIKNGSDYL